MFKNIRKSFASIVASLAIAVIPMLTPAVVFAEANTANGASCGANLTLNSTGGCDVSSGSTGLTNFITNLVNVFSVIVGLVSVIMIIYGGFRYVTSGGDSGNVGAAKNTIIYAVIGLVVVVLAQVIVKFVLDKATTIAQ